jgi:chorismate mutase/prephenate dehydratase
MAALGKRRARVTSVERLRSKIDDVNRKLLRLLAERARLAQAIGELKRRNGEAVYQPAREEAVLDSMAEQNLGPLTDEQVRRIFVEIISACRALERELRIAYLGPPHTYSHQAALNRFGSSAALVAEASIPDVFRAVENGRADFGVVPVENSTEGSVGVTLDLLIDTPLKIVGEVMLPVRHALLSLDGDPKKIRKIVSHQQSLAQCRTYLAANFTHCEQETAASNALAARLAAQDPACAAIASKAAASAYGLKVVADGIQDSPNNATRFLIIGSQPGARAAREKTSLLFSVPDRVGALSQALAAFARNSINLSKIESRPLRARPWQYLFFVDVAGHYEDPKLKRTLAELAHKVLFLKVLGSYPEAAPVERRRAAEEAIGKGRRTGFAERGGAGAV